MLNNKFNLLFLLSILTFNSSIMCMLNNLSGQNNRYGSQPNRIFVDNPYSAGPGTNYRVDSYGTYQKPKTEITNIIAHRAPVVVSSNDVYYGQPVNNFNSRYANHHPLRTPHYHQTNLNYYPNYNPQPYAPIYYRPVPYNYQPIYLNSKYEINDHFKKCTDNFMYNMKFVQSVSRVEYLFQKIDRFIRPTSSAYFIGIRTSKDSMVEGMYKLYKEKMNNPALFHEVEGVIPQFQGCVVLSSITNKKVQLKLETDDVFFIYEKAPLWLDYIEEKQLSMTDLNLSEMVHQLFWFFKKMFESRLFARYFTSNDIGIKTVADVHYNMNMSVNIYSRKKVMYIYRNMYNLSSKCDYVNDPQFQTLLKRFLTNVPRNFQHHGEDDIEICQQINAFNHLLLLEISLYRSNNLTVDKKVLFKGCLSQKEDMGFDCPLPILAVLGRNHRKQFIRDDELTRRYNSGLLDIRNNLLKYNTKSTIKFIEDFLDELLRVFRLYNNGQKVEKIKVDYSKQINYNINNQKNVIGKIQEIRDKTKKPELYEDLIVKVQNNINRLDKMKIVVKEKEEGYADDVQEMSVKGMKDKLKNKITKIEVKKPLNVIYSEERPFQNKVSIDNKMDEFMMNREKDQEIDAIILDDPDVAKSEILKLKKAELTIQTKPNTKDEILDDSTPLYVNTTPSDDLNLGEITHIHEEDLDNDLKMNQTIDQIDIADTQNHDIVKNLIEEDITELEGLVNKIDEEINKSSQPESKDEEASEEIDLNESSDDLNNKSKVEFAEGEKLKFVNELDEQGFEYLSLEINFNLINPKDFGFEDFKQSDQEALEQKVQNHFISALQDDSEMKELGLKVLDMI